MPELPEVEVSRLGISPYLVGQQIKSITIRQAQLRWPIPKQLQRLHGATIERVIRRAKYLVIETAQGNAIIHLGMSGSLRIVDLGLTPQLHDHVDLILNNGKILRYHDPRRFGAWLWCEKGSIHTVMAQLGPEPLSDAFNAVDMLVKAKKRVITIKQMIMDNKIVVGVGNIYASESLFAAGLHPATEAKALTLSQWQRLVTEIKEVLHKAIAQGGTTLKDFTQVDGRPGYFAQELQVYGRAGEQCFCCGNTILSQVIAQRNTFFCPHCQQ